MPSGKKKETFLLATLDFSPRRREDTKKSQSGINDFFVFLSVVVTLWLTQNKIDWTCDR